MAQRDYEDQPEAPDLGAAVQLESDQRLDGPPGDNDALDSGYVPPDRPYALDEGGVTGRGMRDGDTLDERLHRERAELDSDGRDGEDHDRSGRIEIVDEGSALETPDAMDAADVGIDGGAASAEEAAVHETDEPVAQRETEPSVAGSPALQDPELEASLAADPDAERAERDAAREIAAEGIGTEGISTEVVGTEGTGAGGVGADRIDADPDTGGAAAPASGRRDAGPGTGL